MNACASGSSGALVDSDQVEQELGFELSEDEHDLINGNLEPAAESDMVLVLHRPIKDHQAQVDVLPLDITHVNAPLRIYVTRAPIESVQSIQIGEPPGDPLPPIAYVVHFNYIEFIALIGPVGKPSYPAPLICTIKYTSTIPYGGDAIANTIIQRLMREILERRLRQAQNERGELGLQQVSVEGYSRSYQRNLREVLDPEAQQGYTGEEIRGVLRLRRRVIR